MTCRGIVHHLSAHALVTALNYIIRKSVDGQIIQKLCTIETMLSSLALLQVSNPRDTLYALLTLANDVQLLPEQVDYSKSYSHVCKDAVDHIVNSTASLDIICRPWAAAAPGLPSWICQFSQHAFAAGSDAGRVNADSLVGLPGRAIYRAGTKRIQPSLNGLNKRENLF